MPGDPVAVQRQDVELLLKAGAESLKSIGQLIGESGGKVPAKEDNLCGLRFNPIYGHDFGEISGVPAQNL
jgi:hypothetical protein